MIPFDFRLIGRQSEHICLRAMADSLGFTAAKGWGIVWF